MRPEHRRGGIGRAVMEHLAALALGARPRAPGMVRAGVERTGARTSTPGSAPTRSTSGGCCGSSATGIERSLSRRLACATRRRPPEQQLALALVRGQLGGAAELGRRLLVAAEPGEQVAADAGEQVVVGAGPARRRSRSTSSSPTSGPKAMPSATARFSSTIGEGERRRAPRRAPRSAPSRCPRRAAPARGRRRSPPAGRRGRAARGSASARSSAAPAADDQQRVPARAVLVEQQHRLAVGPEPGAAARGLDLEQRDQPVRLRLARAPARRGSGPAAALPRRARAGSSPRRRSPRSPR